MESYTKKLDVFYFAITFYFCSVCHSQRIYKLRLVDLHLVDSGGRSKERVESFPYLKHKCSCLKKLFRQLFLILRAHCLRNM